MKELQIEGTINVVNQIDDGIDNDNVKMQQQMELQLHEQYAINNNSNLSSIIALFVAMLAVIGAYGYVYLHSSCIWDRTVMIGEDRLFTLNALVITAWAAIMTMFVMIYLCIELGMKQRFEQFITFAIRAKYYKTNKHSGYDNSNNTNDHDVCVDKLIEASFDKSYSKIYPQGYHPFNKHCLEAVQGLYGSFVRILGITIMLIVVSLIPKCCYQFNICLSPTDWNDLFMRTILLICGSSLIAFIMIKCRFDYLYEKYKTREDYYKKEIWNVEIKDSENKKEQITQ